MNKNLLWKVLLLFILIVHFFIKDAIYPISILYYIFNSVTLLILLLIVFLFRINNFIDKMILCGSFVMVLISWGVNSFVIDKKDVIGENKVVLWNVADKQKEATDYIVKQIEKENPNLCCLVESKQNGKILKNKLPLHNFKQLRGNMSIFYKGKIDSILYQNKHKSFKYNLIYISNNENLKKILLVDLYASPFVHKKSSLKKIYSLIEIENPDVILGDFNTPYNGSLFLDFKQNFNDFHDLGLGFNSTWPYCIPIFELDMIWLDKKFKPISIERKNNILSDHKLITVTFD